MAELLVGLFLLTCGVLALVAAHIYLLRSQTMTDARAQAGLVANNILNDILSDSFNQSHLRSRTLLSQPAGFSYAVDEHLEQTGLKCIQVSVYFPEKAVEREISLCSLVYDLR